MSELQQPTVATNLETTKQNVPEGSTSQMYLGPTHIQLPFAHLNLRRNPFGELREADWVDVAIVDVSAMINKLQSPKCAIQFVGEKGRGKTTHLLAIKLHFKTAGYVHIAEGTRGSLPSGSPVLVDEAQRLTFFQRCRLFHSNTPLVLGTHKDFHFELGLAGRRVETIQVENFTSLERLHKLVNARIKKFRRGAGAVPEISEATSADLLKKHGPDIRAILHELFETFQQLTHIVKL